MPKKLCSRLACVTAVIVSYSVFMSSIITMNTQKLKWSTEKGKLGATLSDESDSHVTVLLRNVALNMPKPKWSTEKANLSATLSDESDRHVTVLLSNITLNLPRLKAKPKWPTAVILAFPFLHETEILHIKLMMLSAHVDYFIVSESCFNTRGYAKKLYFGDNMHKPPFKEYFGQIIYVLDCRDVVKKDVELGWDQTSAMKKNIGLALTRTHGFPNDTIVVVSDADEVPSRQAVQWLRAQDMSTGHTYDFAPSMPVYMYGFRWLRQESGYSTMTARGIQFERSFWAAVESGENVPQELHAVPRPSGWHCTYCLPDALILEKIYYANAADGPLLLADYIWSNTTVQALKGCGITPQKDRLTDSPLRVPEAAAFPFLNEMPECVDYVHPF